MVKRTEAASLDTLPRFLENPNVGLSEWVNITALSPNLGISRNLPVVIDCPEVFVFGVGKGQVIGELGTHNCVLGNLPGYL